MSNLSSHLKVSIEDSKISEISKFNLGSYFEIFGIHITQNWVSQQLVPFDMLSHIMNMHTMLNYNETFKYKLDMAQNIT